MDCLEDRDVLPQRHNGTANEATINEQRGIYNLEACVSPARVYTPDGWCGGGYNPAIRANYRVLAVAARSNNQNLLTGAFERMVIRE